MLLLRSLIATLVFVVGLSSPVASANWVGYSPEAFAQAQAAGKTILVDVNASWCPTCRAQRPILEELRADQRLNDVVFISVNYDVHKTFLRDHRIPRQSTILIFDGKTEVDRSVAETNRERLRKFVFDAVLE
jgi:thiol-disulfide isomerase/thioredoxin